MLTLALLVISIGLVDSINPSTVAPALLLATQRHAQARVASFTFGVFAVTFVGGVLIVIGPGRLLLDELPHPGKDAKSLAAVIGGGLLLVVAAVLWAGRHHVSRRIAESRRSRAGAGTAAAFAVGAGIMLVELPTAVPYFAAIAAIVASDLSVGAQVLLLALFNLAFVAPLLAILAVRALMGQRAIRTLDALGAWIRRQAAGVVAGLLGLVGAIALVVGIAGLT